MAQLMVVDDDTDVREWIVRCLRQDGHTVVAAASAAEAEQLQADGTDMDAVLLDYALPDNDGVELLAHLRAARPDLPAVFVTVQWSGAIISQIEATGAERISKPFEPDVLRAAVRRALGRAEGAGS